MYRSNGSERGSHGSRSWRLKFDHGFPHADAFYFHLTVASRLIGIGMNLPEVCHDFDGVSRPQNKPYDIGAFRYR